MRSPPVRGFFIHMSHNIVVEETMTKGKFISSGDGVIAKTAF